MPNGHLNLKNSRTALCLLVLAASACSYVVGQTQDLQSPSVALGIPIVEVESLPTPPRGSSASGVVPEAPRRAHQGIPSIISTPPPPRVMRVAGFEGHETYALPQSELYPSSDDSFRWAPALHPSASVSLGTPQPVATKPQGDRMHLAEKTADPKITLDRPVAVAEANSMISPWSQLPTGENAVATRPSLNTSEVGTATLKRPVPVRPVGDANATLAELAIPELGLPVPSSDSSSASSAATLPESGASTRPQLTFDDLLSDLDSPMESTAELAIPNPQPAEPPRSTVGMDALDALPDALFTSENDDELLSAPQRSPSVEELPKPMPSGSPSVPSYSPEDALGLPPVASPSLDPAPPRTQEQLLAPDASSTADTSKPDPSEESAGKQKYDGPYFFEPMGKMTGPRVDTLAKQIPYQPETFMPPPIRDVPVDPVTEGSVYRGKFPVTVQRPLIELWRPLYTSGIYPEAKNWFGDRNLVMPHFMVYGDFRTGMGINRNAQGDTHNLAFRANLDMDLEITATERIHAFMGPLDRGGDFTKLEFANSADWVNRTDMRLDTLFFEGDVGSILAGMRGEETSLDLPFSFGFLPFFYQNGIWANDNALGAAFALPARHSRLLNWSNYDATFFWASDQINSDAFPGDNNAAEFFGTAWFIEAYDGYVEANYAFVHDDVIDDRSYHNLSFAFTRRYLQRLSNSIRYITNVGQNLPSDQRTADGHLILIENSLISSTPNTFVPYLNFFYGQGRTQSLARAGIAGGILNNTGINFENDGLTGYPTLDATGVNATGAALGLNMMGASFEQQLIVEFAALAANGDAQFRNAPGDQYAIGMRYQRPLSNAWIFRTDHMFGFLRNADDIRGSRVEFRMKF